MAPAAIALSWVASIVGGLWFLAARDKPKPGDVVQIPIGALVRDDGKVLFPGSTTPVAVQVVETADIMRGYLVGVLDNGRISTQPPDDLRGILYRFRKTDIARKLA